MPFLLNIVSMIRQAVTQTIACCFTEHVVLLRQRSLLQGRRPHVSSSGPVSTLYVWTQLLLLQNVGRFVVLILKGRRYILPNLIKVPSLANATYVGTSKLGSPSRNIPVNTYQTDLGGTDVKVVVSADGSCTPIMESLAGTIGGSKRVLSSESMSAFVVFYLLLDWGKLILLFFNLLLDWG